MVTTAAVGCVRREVDTSATALGLRALTLAEGAVAGRTRNLRITISGCCIVINDTVAVIVFSVTELGARSAGALPFGCVAGPTGNLAGSVAAAGFGTGEASPYRGADARLAVTAGYARLPLRCRF